MRFHLSTLVLTASSLANALMSATQLTKDIAKLNGQAESFIQQINHLPTGSNQKLTKGNIDINGLITPFVNLVDQGSSLAKNFQQIKKKEPYMAEDGDKIVKALTDLAITLENGLNNVTAKLDIVKGLQPLNLGNILTPLIDAVKNVVANLFGSLRQTLQGTHGRQVREIARSIDAAFESTSIQLRR